MNKLTMRGKILLGLGAVVLMGILLGGFGWMEAGHLQSGLASRGAEGASRAEVFDQVRRIKVLFAAIVFAVLTAGSIVSFLLNRAVAKTIRQHSSSLYDAANQVSGASSQVSVASQSLAEGTSEQAASLEESCAAMEEMASMVKKNAENTREAARLVEISRQSMKTSHRSLKTTMETMKLISASGAQTAKIIKTIDEVAFQTNLLALNAAVEAARAGEAGAGFAVVAEEVRNLALRATEAAKDTEKIINETIQQVQVGENLIDQTMKEFYKMGDDAKEVSSLFSEISVASDKQSKGIEQVNLAIHEMDKVVQQNAANAEESAAAAEELHAQAGLMRSMVRQMAAMVGGSNGNDPNGHDLELIHASRGIVQIGDPTIG